MNIIRTFYYSFEPNKNQEANPFIFEVNPSRILKDTNDLNIVDDNKQSSPKIENRVACHCHDVIFGYSTGNTFLSAIICTPPTIDLLCSQWCQ